MDDTTIDTQEYEQVRPIPKLNLPDLVELDCIRPKGDGANLIFYCEPVQVYKGPCTECGAPRSNYDSRGYGRDRRVHDISMGLVHVDIVLRTPRFLCKCGASFSYPFETVMYRKPFTKRLYEQIQIRALKEPFVKIANEYGISITTVAKIFEEYASELDKSRKVTAPKVLGIDEKHIVHAKRGVLVDIRRGERGVLLDMTPDNDVATIRGAIERMADYDKNIEWVTIDMYTGYVSVVQECLPNARIVVDKFHVLQNLYRKIEKVRKPLYAELKKQVSRLPDGEDKDSKTALLTRMGKNVYLFKFGRTKLAERLERSSLMAELCSTFPELNNLRLLKVGFERIYDVDDRKEAEKRFEEWQKLIPAGKEDIYAPIYTLQRSMKTWKEHIFSYFDTDKECRLTNATVEGINSLIGHLNNEGRGYKFSTLRLKCLLHKEAADKPHFMRVGKINYDFKKSTQAQQGMMQRSAYGTGYANDYLDNLFSDALQDEVQVSGGGVFIDRLLADIKDRL